LFGLIKSTFVFRYLMFYRLISNSKWAKDQWYFFSASTIGSKITRLSHQKSTASQVWRLQWLRIWWISITSWYVCVFFKSVDWLMASFCC